MDKLLTAKDVCHRLSISKTTLGAWVRAGAIPAPIGLGRVRRWPPAAIDAAVERLSNAANANA
jgi:excisionase family DNA binding protein